MDGKRTRCLQIVWLHSIYYYFWDTARYLWKNRHFIISPLHPTPPLGGFPSEYRHPLWDGKTRMVSLSVGEKISKISLFVLTWSTNVTDRHCVTAKTAFASHRAVKRMMLELLMYREIASSHWHCEDETHWHWSWTGLVSVARDGNNLPLVPYLQ